MKKKIFERPMDKQTINDGIKIDMSWVIGKCRIVIIKEMIKKLSNLTKINTIIYYDAYKNLSTSSQYVIVERVAKDTVTIYYTNDQKLSKNDKINSFDKIPYREVMPNQVLNAVSYKELQYNIPHDRALEQLEDDLNKKIAKRFKETVSWTAPSKIFDDTRSQTAFNLMSPFAKLWSDSLK